MSHETSPKEPWRIEQELAIKSFAEYCSALELDFMKLEDEELQQLRAIDFISAEAQVYTLTKDDESRFTQSEIDHADATLKTASGATISCELLPEDTQVSAYVIFTPIINEYGTNIN